MTQSIIKLAQSQFPRYGSNQQQTQSIFIPIHNPFSNDLIHHSHNPNSIKRLNKKLERETVFNRLSTPIFSFTTHQSRYLIQLYWLSLLTSKIFQHHRHYQPFFIVQIIQLQRLSTSNFWEHFPIIIDQSTIPRPSTHRQQARTHKHLSNSTTGGIKYIYHCSINHPRNYSLNHPVL